jgi:predicted SAM-dependent methyltransferase
MSFASRIAHKLLSPHVWANIRDDRAVKKMTKQAGQPKYKTRLAEIKKQQSINLQLGCGKRIMKGWVNTDLSYTDGVDLQLNFLEPLPFETESVERIYSEHVLEHFVKENAEQIIKECFRILKKGGKIRIGVPDAEIYFRKYLENDREFFSKIKRLGGAMKPLELPIDVINQMFRMGGAHLFAWDFEAMKKSMEAAGFRNITKKASMQSSDQTLLLDDPEHAFETLYVEAEK